jgi:hypothetical protein
VNKLKKSSEYVPLSLPVLPPFRLDPSVVDVLVICKVEDVVGCVVVVNVSPLRSTSLRPNSQPKLLRKHSRNSSEEDRGRSRCTAVVAVVVAILVLVAVVVVAAATFVLCTAAVLIVDVLPSATLSRSFRTYRRKHIEYRKEKPMCTVIFYGKFSSMSAKGASCLNVIRKKNLNIKKFKYISLLPNFHL